MVGRMKSLSHGTMRSWAERSLQAAASRRTPRPRAQASTCRCATLQSLFSALCGMTAQGRSYSTDRRHSA